MNTNEPTWLTKGQRVLVTAALPYANGSLHVGHIAGAYLPSDIFRRYVLSRGVECLGVCGSDDHGVAMILAAKKESMEPADLVTKYNARQAQDLKNLEIDFDIYGSTSKNPYHSEISQDFFKTLYEKGFFEKQVTDQFYDPKASQFLPDRFVRGTCGLCGALDQGGDQCEQCGKILEPKDLKDPKSVLSGDLAVLKETAHWFLDLSKFEGKVKEWLDNSTVREHTKTFVMSLVSQGLVKRSMTRDLSWGIPVPLEDPDAKGKCLYVWFDAPIGYISNTYQYTAEKEGAKEKGDRWWKSDDSHIFHFIGEDNTIFHALIWIAMLAAGDYHLPDGVIVNQFLNFRRDGDTEDQKMSKSRGTALWIGDYVERGGNINAIRYYLTAIAPEKARSAFNYSDLVARYHGELSAAVGNLFQRILSFSRKNFGPQAVPNKDSDLIDADREFWLTLVEKQKEITNLMNGFCFRDAMAAMMELARATNKHLDVRAPWKAIKTDKADAQSSVALCFRVLKLLATDFGPFLPSAAREMAALLGYGEKIFSWDEACVPVPDNQPLPEPKIIFVPIEEDDEATA